MRNVIVLALILSFFCENIQAFDWDSCMKDKFAESFQLMMPVISSTQFMSSWGGCAMIGIANHDKKVFLAHNLDQIQNDSARGGGEYLQAYSQLSGCDSDASKKLSIILKENFIKIYGVDGSKQPQEIYESMEEIMKSDPNISSGCSRGV